MRALLFALLLAAAPTARAAEAQLWVQGIAQAELSETVVGYVEAQPRIGDEGLSELLLRPALYLRVLPGLTAWGGYLFNPDLGNGHEHRTWEQLQLTAGVVLLRARLEQRFVEGAPSAPSHRIRGMARVAVPIGGGIKLAVSDELMSYLSDAGAPPVGGLDQNRAFLGLNTSTAIGLFEAGYLAQTLFRPAGDEWRHVLFAQWMVGP